MNYVLTKSNRLRIFDMLAKLDCSKPWDLAIEPHRQRRSNSQNARLWALHTLAAQVTGCSAEEMHEYALCRFFGYDEKKVGGIVRHIPLKRSSVRNIKEFAAFMESTESWYISEFGVWLDAAAA